MKGCSQLFGHQPQIEALLVRMALDASESLGKRLGVTVLAAWADLTVCPIRGGPLRRMGYANPTIPQ
jgi:hypothetical protein